MSSITNPQSDLPGDELVAYLDGELSPEECRRIEERLAVDADYRQQLHELDQTWEVLGALPPATVDDNFARTTIEMVAVAAQDEVSSRAAQAAVVNRKRRWASIACAVVATIAGFVIVRGLSPNANDRLVADLPIIRQFELLRQIDDVEFLRKLPQAVPLEQLVHDQVAIDRELTAATSAAASSLEERRKWVQGLSPDDKANLAAQARRFADVARRDAQKEKQLRGMEREISQDTDADQLRKTMVIYSRWLARRSPGDQEDLRVLSDDKRLEEIARIVRREGEEASRHLSAADSAALRDEIFEIFEERRSDFQRAMRRRDRDNRPFLEGPRARLALMVIHWELRNDDRDDKTSDRLTGVLSDEAQEYWNGLRQRRYDRRRVQLLQWMSEAMRPRWDPSELEKFFTEELDTSRKERLLSLPRDEMQAQLERLFVENRLGFTGPDEWQGGFGDVERFQGRPPGRPDGRPRKMNRMDGPPRPDDEQVEHPPPRDGERERQDHDDPDGGRLDVD